MAVQAINESVVLTDERIDQVLSVLHSRTGMNFIHYARPSIVRRLRVFLQREGLPDLLALPLLLEHDPALTTRLVNTLTVHFTELFRDPEFFRAIREQVLPFLATYPRINIWHAGCSTGEEVYSMAIMLDEVNLLRKARIYATDINTDVLEQAQEGSFSPALFSHYTRNYRQAGGRGQLTDYCAPVNGRIVMKDQLRRRISFHQHNLAADASFNEFHLILCRNVMIYFDPLLQERATRLFHESLVNLGYFAIGNKESLRFNRMRTSFVTIDGSHKIFRKVRFQKL